MNNNDNNGIPIELAVEALGHITATLARFTNWLIFATFHIGFLSVFLFSVWYYHVSPEDIMKAYQAFLHLPGVTNIHGIFGVLGLSLGAFLYGYAKLCQRIFRKRFSAYALKNLK